VIFVQERNLFIHSPLDSSTEKFTFNRSVVLTIQTAKWQKLGAVRYNPKIS
jgi:hypothetical protein